MKRQTGIRYAVLAAFLAASAASGAALAVDEAEFNNLFQTPQSLTIGSDGTVTVNAVMGTETGTMVADVDFFSFDGTEGDVVTIDIDGGMKATGRSVDTIVAIFGPCGILCHRQKDDAAPADEGSISSLDARLDLVRLPVTGTYTVGVSSSPRAFRPDGTTISNALNSRSNGRYTLIISGVTVALQQINIEIKPGSGELAPLNPKSRGNIPVALLSSDEFYAPDVDPTSLTFGSTGDEASFRRCNKQGEDVNGDGKLDLVCHFDNQTANFQRGDLEAVLKGRTQAAADGARVAGGTEFEGRGLLKVLPEKRD
jgi:hypothetical protein